MDEPWYSVQLRISLINLNNTISYQLHSRLLLENYCNIRFMVGTGKCTTPQQKSILCCERGVWPCMLRLTLTPGVPTECFPPSPMPLHCASTLATSSTADSYTASQQMPPKRYFIPPFILFAALTTPFNQVRISPKCQNGEDRAVGQSFILSVHFQDHTCNVSINFAAVYLIVTSTSNASNCSTSCEKQFCFRSK